MEFIKSIFQSLFEDTTITINFLKSHFFNTSCFEINILFAIFISRELKNFIVKLTHSILGWWQITRPIRIGRAQARKIFETRPILQGGVFAL